MEKWQWLIDAIMNAAEANKDNPGAVFLCILLLLGCAIGLWIRLKKILRWFK